MVQLRIGLEEHHLSLCPGVEGSAKAYHHNTSHRLPHRATDSIHNIVLSCDKSSKSPSLLDRGHCIRYAVFAVLYVRWLYQFTEWNGLALVNTIICRYARRYFQKVPRIRLYEEKVSSHSTSLSITGYRPRITYLLSNSDVSLKRFALMCGLCIIRKQVQLFKVK